MLNTPSELSTDLDESNDADLEETTEELEESQSVEDEELEEPEGNEEQDEDEEETFLVGDKKITASHLEELEKGQMLQSDYTKKRQAESAEHKARMSDIDKLIEEADLLESFIEEDEKAVDWDSLMKSEEREIESKFKARRKQVNDIRNKASAAKTKIDQSTIAETNQAVHSHFTEWQGKNGEKAQKSDLDEALKYAKSIGYTDEKIARLSDPEQFIAIIEAAKYRAIKNAKPEKKRSKQTPKSVGKKKAPVKAEKSVAELFYGT